MLCNCLFLCFVCPSRDSQPFWVSHQSKWMLSAADASPRQKLIFLCFIIWQVAQVAQDAQAMQCNGGQNWFLPQLTFCTSGSGRSLYVKSKNRTMMFGRWALWCLLLSHLVQLQRQISMGRRGEGWSLVMCGPDSSGALSPSLIIYPPSTSLSLDKNGVQGNPVNFPKLSGNFNNEKPQFRGFTGACRWWWCF